MSELIDQISRVASRGGLSSRVALADDAGEKVSFGELLELLSDRGSRTGELAMLMAANDLHSICTYLKCLSAGYSIMLVSTQVRLEELQTLIRRYQPDKLVVSTQVASKLALSGYTTTRTQCNGTELVEFDVLPELKGIRLDTQYTLLLTSGSTGSPKVVRLCQKGVLQNAIDIKIGLSVEDHHRALLSLPIHYSYGLSVLHSHLVAGASLFLTKSTFVERNYFQILAENQVTTFAGVPATYLALLKLGYFENRQIKIQKFSQAGGRLSPTAIRQVATSAQRNQFDFQPMYGQTEATARISMMPAGLALEYPDCVGKPVASGKIWIEEAGGSTEVMFSAPSVMHGYAERRQELNDIDRLRGVLRTGDLGEWQAGLLRITGRIKRIAKVRGVRINLDDVESDLRSNFADGDVAVIASDDRFKIFVTDQIAVDFMSTQLVKTLRLNKNEFEISVLESLPLTDSGKVNYAALEGI